MLNEHFLFQSNALFLLREVVHLGSHFVYSFVVFQVALLAFSWLPCPFVVRLGVECAQCSQRAALPRREVQHP